MRQVDLAGLMIATEGNNQLLEKYLGSYGIETTSEQRELMLRHLDLVAEKNKVVNLTRIVDPGDAIVRHVVDSLLLLPCIESVGLDQSARFVDIGTGAGFPGIPLCVATGTRGTLIDSIGKKVRAVQEFVEALSIVDSCEAKAIRAEDLARECREGYQLVVARAVADLGVLVEYASPLLEKGGYLVVSKGRIDKDEIERGTKTGELVGLSNVSRETFELPLDMGHREILCMKKTGKSRVKLPRNTGMAKSKPLVI